jgi:hypothetical protein
MTTPQITIFDAITGKTIIRDMNETEIAQHESDIAEAKKIATAQAKADKLAAEKKQVILDRLGITNEELKAILL